MLHFLNRQVLRRTFNGRSSGKVSHLCLEIRFFTRDVESDSKIPKKIVWQNVSVDMTNDNCEIDHVPSQRFR